MEFLEMTLKILKIGMIKRKTCIRKMSSVRRNGLSQQNIIAERYKDLQKWHIGQ